MLTATRNERRSRRWQRRSTTYYARADGRASFPEIARNFRRGIGPISANRYRIFRGYRPRLSISAGQITSRHTGSYGPKSGTGIVKAKANGAYRGRREDTDRNAGIAGMLRAGMSWSAIQPPPAVAAPRLPRSPSASSRSPTANPTTTLGLGRSVPVGFHKFITPQVC
jgi:hypothetical protein